MDRVSQHWPAPPGFTPAPEPPAEEALAPAPVHLPAPQADAGAKDKPITLIEKAG